MLVWHDFSRNFCNIGDFTTIVGAPNPQENRTKRTFHMFVYRCFSRKFSNFLYLFVFLFFCVSFFSVDHSSPRSPSTIHCELFKTTLTTQLWVMQRRRPWFEFAFIVIPSVSQHIVKSESHASLHYMCGPGCPLRDWFLGQPRQKLQEIRALNIQNSGTVC